MSVRERSKGLSKKDQKIINTVVDYKEVFSTEAGQRVLNDLLDEGYMLRPSFSDIRGVTEYNEGRRSLVLYILHKLETDPKKLLDLINKSNEESDNFENY